MEVKAYKTKKAPDPGASCGSDLPQIGAIDGKREPLCHWYYYSTNAPDLQGDFSEFTKGKQNFDTFHKKITAHLSNLLSTCGTEPVTILVKEEHDGTKGREHL